MTTPTNEFDSVWRTLPVPGEYDAMDVIDQQRWRGLTEDAFEAGRAAALKEAAEIIDEAALKSESDDFALDALTGCAAAIRAMKGKTP